MSDDEYMASPSPLPRRQASRLETQTAGGQNSFQTDQWRRVSTQHCPGSLVGMDLLKSLSDQFRDDGRALTDDNVFNIHSIDTLANVVFSEYDGVDKLALIDACTEGLQVGTIIYSKRVDIAYKETSEILMDLVSHKGGSGTTADTQQQQDQQEQDCGEKAGDNTDATKRRRARAVVDESSVSVTLADEDSLCQKGGDEVTLEADPFFSKLSMLFDAQNPASLLLLNLGVCDGTEILFDSHTQPLKAALDAQERTAQERWPAGEAELLRFLIALPPRPARPGQHVRPAQPALPALAAGAPSARLNPSVVCIREQLESSRALDALAACMASPGQLLQGALEARNADLSKHGLLGAHASTMTAAVGAAAAAATTTTPSAAMGSQQHSSQQQQCHADQCPAVSSAGDGMGGFGCSEGFEAEVSGAFHTSEGIDNDLGDDYGGFGGGDDGGADMDGGGFGGGGSPWGDDADDDTAAGDGYGGSHLINGEEGEEEPASSSAAALDDSMQWLMSGTSGTSNTGSTSMYWKLKKRPASKAPQAAARKAPVRRQPAEAKILDFTLDEEEEAREGAAAAFVPNRAPAKLCIKRRKRHEGLQLPTTTRPQAEDDLLGLTCHDTLGVRGVWHPIIVTQRYQQQQLEQQQRIRRQQQRQQQQQQAQRRRSSLPAAGVAMAPMADGANDGNADGGFGADQDGGSGYDDGDGGYEFAPGIDNDGDDGGAPEHHYNDGGGSGGGYARQQDAACHDDDGTVGAAAAMLAPSLAELAQCSLEDLLVPMPVQVERIAIAFDPNVKIIDVNGLANSMHAALQEILPPPPPQYQQPGHQGQHNHQHRQQQKRVTLQQLLAALPRHHRRPAELRGMSPAMALIALLHDANQFGLRLSNDDDPNQLYIEHGSGGMGRAGQPLMV